MKDKFVLWRFVGLQSAKSGKVGVQRFRCYWKVHDVFESVDDAIVEIIKTHSKNRSKLTDSSWLVTLNWKVQFDTISTDGYINGIYTEACPDYCKLLKDLVHQTNPNLQGDVT